MTAEAGLQTVAQTKTKMALVGSRCEKAKHHLNPSPKRPKTLRNRKRKTGETLPTEPSKDKKKIASSTTNLQAAGKTCPKTSWAFKKPASSSAENSKHPNVTFGSHYERDSKTPQKTLETSPLERTTERDSKTSEPALHNERLCHKNSKNQRARRQKTRNTQTSPLDHTMKEIAKRHKNAR